MTPSTSQSAAEIEVGRRPRSLTASVLPNPRLGDAAVVGLVVIAEVVAVIVKPWPGWEREVDVGAAGLIAVAVIPLCWRRRFPVAVTAAAASATLVWDVVQYAGGTRLAVLAGLFSVGLYDQDRHRSQLVAVVVSVFGGALTLLGGMLDRDVSFSDPIVGLLAPAVVWFAADRIRTRNDYVDLLEERARRLEHERDVEAFRAVAEERTRIARELHDVVAHRVSMMTVQAHAARMLVRDDNGEAGQAMQAVTDAGKQAMAELRQVLDVLRLDTGSRGGEPLPGFGDVEALVASVRQTGLDVTLDYVGEPCAVPSAMELSAYRIVQEALTNVMKHGRSVSAVEVVFGYGPHDLVVTIVDDGRNVDTLGRGHGLIGMQERVQLFGGRLDAGPTNGSGFRVEATFPLP